MTLSQLYQTQQQQLDASRVKTWMHNHYDRYTDDATGELDTDALIEAAMRDLFCTRQMAEDLAVEVAKEVDGK